MVRKAETRLAVQRSISIEPIKANCDSSYHAVVGYKNMSNRYKEETKKWFANADLKSLSFRSLLNDAMLAVYNEDNKSEHSPISKAIEQSGAHLDNPVAANMELKFMPAAHELGILVELRMKCLILAGDSTFEKKHNLTYLWSKMTDEVRREIERHYANQIQRMGGQVPSVISEGNVAKDMEQIGDEFIHWRYEPRPDNDTYLKYMKLGFINHVLEYAMLKYRQD